MIRGWRMGWAALGAVLSWLAIAALPGWSGLPSRRASQPSSARADTSSAGRITVTVRVVSAPPVVYVNRLEQNVPNPFRGTTTLRYSCAKPGPVRVRLYTIRGRELVTLVDGWHAAGAYELQWDCRDKSGRQVAAGVYLCRMEGPGFVAAKKIQVVP